MTRLPTVDDPCPHCGRRMRRSAAERLTDPFCAACLNDRLGPPDPDRAPKIRPGESLRQEA